MSISKLRNKAWSQLARKKHFALTLKHKYHYCSKLKERKGLYDKKINDGCFCGKFKHSFPSSKKSLLSTYLCMMSSFSRLIVPWASVMTVVEFHSEADE